MLAPLGSSTRPLSCAAARFGKATKQITQTRKKGTNGRKQRIDRPSVQTGLHHARLKK
jgi:hypothetical protein